MKAFFDLPFIQVALPIIIAIVLAIFVQNKRIDDLRDSVNKRLDEVIKRLDRIEFKLENHGERIVKLEERTSLLRG